MPSPTYALLGTEAVEAQCRQLSRPFIQASLWQAFAGVIAGQRGLTPFSASALADRWQRGYTSVVVNEERILAHASYLPVYFETTRERVAERLGTSPTRLPQIGVYETLTGWTDPILRGQGVGLRLQRELFERFVDPGSEGQDCAEQACLVVGVTVGLGAGPILARMGWQILGWSQVGYLSSMLADSSVECQEGQLTGWRLPGVKPYQGDALSPFGGTGHRWEDFCHLWVSDVRLAKSLNRELSLLAGGDLCRWRAVWQAVIREVLLDEGWLPILLDE